jgi:hypothetical protein
MVQALLDAGDRRSQMPQKFSLFFASTLGAHMEAMFSPLFRLVDKRRGAVSVENFLTFANKHASILPYGTTGAVERRVKKDLVILDELEPQLNGLLERRNKLGAHLSLEYLPDSGRKVENDFPLNLTEIEAILQEIDFILGHHHEFCHGTGYVPTSHDQFFYTHAVEDVIKRLETN